MWENAMRGATWMLLGVGSFAGVAGGQGLNFTTVVDNRTTLGGGAETITAVNQVVLQDDNAVAAIVRFGAGGDTPSAITFNPSPGNAATRIVAQSGQPRSTFGVGGASGAGEFEEFYNLSSVGGAVTFGAGNFTTSGDRGIFRYAYDATSPTRATIHFEGNALADGASASVDTDNGGLPSYGVNASGHVVFSARTVAPSTPANTQLIARSTGGGAAPAARIIDTSSGITRFNLTDDNATTSFFPQRKLITASGHAVFVGDGGSGREIYDIGPGPTLTPQVRVPASLGGAGEYEVQRVLGASGDAVTGTTLFHAFANRPVGSPPDDNWPKGALMVTSPLGPREIGAFDTSLPSSNGEFSPSPTAVMTPNGRVAAFLPQDTGGRVVYYDVATGAATGTTVAEYGTAVDQNGVDSGFTIKHVSMDYVSVPMVNAKGTVVFDAVIQSGTDVRDALLAWKPGSANPFVVAKTGDTITIGGQSETIGLVGVDFSTFQGSLSPFPADLAYDADVLKDGLNDNDYLAFAVRFDGFAGQAVLLTHLPEPGMLMWLGPVLGVMLMRRRARRRP
jgi:hypothetical protein